MNLIEQLGGYEKCKEILKTQTIDILMNAQALREHMLKHCRQNNIFEIGDIVFFKESSDDRREICRIDEKSFLYHAIKQYQEHYRHATQQEIKAGHRL